MQQYVSIDTLANWVTMLRAGVDGAILLSDDDDAPFYERCVHDEARVIPAGDVVLALLKRMTERGIHGLVATSRGLDHDGLEPNVFQPSLGDIASLLLFSKSAETVLKDICGSAWLDACVKEIGPICRRAAWIAKVIRYLCQISDHEWICSAEDTKISEVINWSSFEIGWDLVDPTLRQKGLSEQKIQQAHDVRPSADFRSDLLDCDGMTAVRILAAASRLYHPRGLSAQREVSGSYLIGMLRVAFELKELEEDEIYWRMRVWERANINYPLLRQWRILDPLGVVLDQRYWESDLKTMLQLLQPSEVLALFKMDLDDFKPLNDALGHGVGDEAIRLYCEIVKQVLGASGEVYRRGGDEVVVLAPGLAEPRAQALGEKVRLQVEVRFKAWSTQRGAPSSPTASIGLVLATRETTPARASQLADEALMQAKQQGKNRVFYLLA